MNLGSPTVSVLVKAYNHAPYVRHTIESVLEQSFQDFEIVVTDDASTDATADILRGFGDPRVKLAVNARNLGISGAMNVTIARARGRYLAILNSDDWALPNRLGRQVDFLNRHRDIAAVFGLPRPVGEFGEVTTAHNDFAAALRLPNFSRGTWLRRIFFAGNCLCSPTAMIRREAYDAVGLYDRRLTNLQDMEMWVRMLIAGQNFHMMPEEVTAMRIRANQANMSAPRPDTVLRSMFEVTKILRHYARFDEALFDEVFGGERGDVALPGDSIAQQVAALALRDPGLPYQNFALEVFHETARTTDDFDRLRVLTGSVDAMGARMIAELSGTLMTRGEEMAGLRSEIALLREKMDLFRIE